jgi:uncharacterized protein YqeY
MPDAPLKIAVHTQMIAAMKGGDKARTAVLRMVLSEIKAVEADKPDADPLGAVQSYSKKLKKTMAEMEKLNQPQQVAQLKAEIAIVDEFLPKQLDDAALAALVDQTLAAMPGVTAKDSGKLIGAVMKAAGGAADAGKVRALIQSKLQ